MGQKESRHQKLARLFMNVVELHPSKVWISWRKGKMCFRGTADVLFVLRSTCLHTAANDGSTW